MAIRHVYLHVCAAWQTPQKCIISQLYRGYVIKVHATTRFYESQHNVLNVVSKLHVLIIIKETVIPFFLTEFENMSLVIQGMSASPIQVKKE